VEVVTSLSEGRTAAAQCGLFTYKSVPVIFEPPCNFIQAQIQYRLPMLNLSDITSKFHVVKMLATVDLQLIIPLY